MDERDTIQEIRERLIKIEMLGTLTNFTRTQPTFKKQINHTIPHL